MIIRSIKIETYPWRGMGDGRSIALRMEVNVEGYDSLKTEQIIFFDDLEATFDTYLDCLFKRLREEFRSALKNKNRGGD